jgi:hypothetical protein
MNEQQQSTLVKMFDKWWDVEQVEGMNNAMEKINVSNSGNIVTTGSGKLLPGTKIRLVTVHKTDVDDLVSGLKRSNLHGRKFIRPRIRKRY